MKLNNKGFQITEIPMIAIVLGVIAIVIGAMATTLVSMRDTSGNTATATLTDDNNTKTLTDVAIYYADYDVKGYPALSCSDVSVFNTTGTNLTSAITLSGTGNCYIVTNSTFNDTAFEIIYDGVFTTYTYAYNFSQQGLEAQNTLSGWQQTWVVIIASAVVLGIISAYLLTKRE